VKRSIYTISLLGLSLFVGSACNNRRELRQNAREERREAQETQGKANEEAREAQEAQSKANEEAREARQAERQAAQAQQGTTPGLERQPVAGREPVMVVEESVRSELGNDWIVTRSNDTVGATRKTQKTPARGLSEKVNDKIRSLRTDHRGLFIDVRRPDAVTIHGDIATCEDAANVADSFAKINGVNQINVRVNCLGK
jgi:heme exporter protein D